MQIEIKIDSSATEPKVIVLTDRMTQEVEELVRKLSETEPQMVVGFLDDTIRILNQDDILRIYAENGEVFADTGEGKFLLRLRLYEMEERLCRGSFVRISHSEIINLKQVRHFDLSFSGTICVSLLDGTVTYVSRRYVSKVKKVLGL